MSLVPERLKAAVSAATTLTNTSTLDHVRLAADIDALIKKHEQTDEWLGLVLEMVKGLPLLLTLDLHPFISAAMINLFGEGRPEWTTEVQAEIAPLAESHGLTMDAALDLAKPLAQSLVNRRTRRQQDFENKLSEALSRSVLHHSDLWASTGEGAATQADTNMTSAAASTHSATSQVGPGLHHAD